MSQQFSSFANPQPGQRSSRKSGLPTNILADRTSSLSPSSQAQALGNNKTIVTNAFEAELLHQIQKHFVEIDLYSEDSGRTAMANEKQAAHSYNFYGTVGAVQTGGNAVSNIVQSLGADEKERLKQALREVQAELANSGVAAGTREELEQVFQLITPREQRVVWGTT
jgi:hypothetical protein